MHIAGLSGRAGFFAPTQGRKFTIMKAKLCWTAVTIIIVCSIMLHTPLSASERIEDIYWLTIENSYLGVALGIDGAYQIPSPYSHCFYEGLQPISGRIDIYRTGGDPKNPDDDGIGMVYGPYAPPCPGDRWMGFALMVDALSTDGESSQMVWTGFPRGGSSGIIGDQQNGWWRTFPYKPDNEQVLRAVAYPVPTGGTVPYGPIATEANLGSAGVTPPNIKCELQIRVMRDMAQFKWVLTNEDIIEHEVGLKLFMDTQPSMQDDGTEDLRNIVSVPGHPLITAKTLLQGNNDVPDAIEMFNSSSDPTLDMRMILKGQNATTPDVVGIDNWAVFFLDRTGGIAESDWTYWYGDPMSDIDPSLTWRYETVEHHPITDLAYGAFWKPQYLAPGQSRTIICYIGLASSTSDFNKPNQNQPQYVAGVQGPRTLKYYESFGVGSLYPDSFEITAYMEEIEKGMDLLNPSFTLHLPTGLTLDPSESGKYTKSIAKIPEGTEAAISWKVIPAGNPTGILDYSVSFSSQVPTGTSVTRKINIPATQWQEFTRGWQMVSVPFDLDDPDPAKALGLDITPGIEYRFWKYDPHLRQYQPVYQLVPGESYWLWLSGKFTTAMAPGSYHPITWVGTKGRWIDLQSGWNLIGNPFVYTVTLGELRFYHQVYGVLNYDEAVKYGLISKSVFWWDPVFKKYNWTSDRDAQFKPWQGYWVRALQDGVSIITTPESQIGASLGGNPSGGGGGVIPPPTP